MPERFVVREFTKSIIFDGVDDFVTVPLIPSVTAFSFAFWIKPAVLANNARVIDCQASGPADGFTVVCSTSGGVNNLQFVIRNSSTAVASINSGALPIAKWSFLAGTYAVNSVKWYLNGAQVGATDTSATMTVSAAAFTIGRRAGTSSNYISALMDEFMFWNGTVLTATEINDLYYKYLIPGTPTAYLKFDDGVTDSSGNGNNGTASGTPAYSTDRRFAARSSIT